MKEAHHGKFYRPTKKDNKLLQTLCSWIWYVKWTGKVLWNTKLVQEDTDILDSKIFIKEMKLAGNGGLHLKSQQFGRPR